jgi:sulfur carrier protein ThiS
MRIRLSYVGYLKIDGVENDSDVEVGDDMSLEDFLTQHGVREEHQKFITPMVNGAEKKLSYVLRDGDNLTLFLPVGGG